MVIDLEDARWIGFRRDETDVARLRAAVRKAVIESSVRFSDPNFTEISADDLAALFRSYDTLFFDGFFHREIGGRLEFGFIRRDSQLLGSTAMLRDKESGAQRFRIRVSTGSLFSNFEEGDRAVIAEGIPCRDRLDGTMAIMEHEIIHLLEYVLFDDSRCQSTRFLRMTKAIFTRSEITHEDLISKYERAADCGIRPGSHVEFDLDGAPIQGTVSRVGTRIRVATDQGEYYVPLPQLRLSG